MRNSFANWMRRVNFIVERKFFIEVDDMPDTVDWYAYFESGLTPNQAFLCACNGEYQDELRLFAMDCEV